METLGSSGSPCDLLNLVADAVHLPIHLLIEKFCSPSLMHGFGT